MADRTAGPSTNTESHVDFASLPPSALDSYIAYYGLAKTYPPPPSKRYASPESSSNEDDTMNDVDTKEIGQDDHLGSRRGSRQRNGGDDGQQMTSSRLRPRSPTSSVAHLYGLGRRGGDEGLASNVNGEASAAEAEEDPSPSHFFDVQEADDYLASVASRHFAAQPPPKEGEVVVQFLYRCRASDKCLKVAS